MLLLSLTRECAGPLQLLVDIKFYTVVLLITGTARRSVPQIDFSACFPAPSILLQKASTG
jgi:hypothetical protein